MHRRSRPTLPSDSHYVWYRVGVWKSHLVKYGSDNYVTYKPGLHDKRSMVLWKPNSLPTNVKSESNTNRSAVGIEDLPNEILGKIVRYVACGDPNDSGGPKTYDRDMYPVHGVGSNTGHDTDIGSPTRGEKIVYRARIPFSSCNKRIRIISRCALQDLYTDPNNDRVWKQQLAELRNGPEAQMLAKAVRKVYILGDSLFGAVQRTLPLSILLKILRLCPNVKEFRIPSWQPVTQNIARCIFQRCPNLSVWDRRLNRVLFHQSAHDLVREGLGKFATTLERAHLYCDSIMTANEMVRLLTISNGRLERLVIDCTGESVPISLVVDLIVSQRKLKFLEIRASECVPDTPVLRQYLQNWLQQDGLADLSIKFTATEMELVREHHSLVLEGNVVEAAHVINVLSQRPAEFAKAFDEKKEYEDNWMGGLMARIDESIFESLETLERTDELPLIFQHYLQYHGYNFMQVDDTEI